MEPEKAGMQPPPYNQGQPAGYPPPQGMDYNQTQPGGYNPGYPAPQQPAYQPQPTTVVVTQPTVTPVVVAGIRPNNYMVPSILVCLFCFWPTGLCAIYYASQANSAAAAGDMAAAQSNANTARNLVIASVVVGVVWIILVIVLRVAVYSTTTTYSYSY